MSESIKLPILIVEDDADLRRILQFQLESEGYSVHQAENGKVAHQLIQQHDFACILLDLMMPEMDGFDFLKRARFTSHGRRTPIVVLTASHDERHRRRSDQYLADGFLTKPYDLDELTATIRRLCAEVASQNV